MGYLDLELVVVGLGMILCASGKGAEAVEYYQKNLRVLKEFLGENHLDVAKAHVHIGNYYKSARKHKLALEHYTVALNIRCCSLGEEHPEVASTLSCAGHQTRLTGDTSEAERLLRYLTREVLHNGWEFANYSCNLSFPRT